MSKIDKEKEYIGAIKVYLGFLLASLIATITGTSKLYLSNQSGIMFWLGILGIILIAFAFIGLVRSLIYGISKNPRNSIKLRNIYLESYDFSPTK